ncbi:MAG: hypothetical protein JRH20_14080 [Deltaproteobacteria bacterium]|nr:hypothetical protein [Deltaproteobacteria bacterium]
MQHITLFTLLFLSMPVSALALPAQPWVVEHEGAPELESSPNEIAPGYFSPSHPSPQQMLRERPSYPSPQQMRREKPSYPSPQQMRRERPSYPSPQQMRRERPSYPSPQQMRRERPSYPSLR